MIEVKAKNGKELKAMITSEMVEKGKALFAAMARVDIIRPIVEKYRKEILQKHQFHIAKKWIDKGMTDHVITSKIDDYLMSDEDAQIYFSELSKAHKEHCFDVPDGYCPLLIAENEDRKAFWELVDAFEPITGIDREKVAYKFTQKYRTLLCKIIATYIKEMGL